MGTRHHGVELASQRTVPYRDRYSGEAMRADLVTMSIPDVGQRTMLFHTPPVQVVTAARRFHDERGYDLRRAVEAAEQLRCRTAARHAVMWARLGNLDYATDIYEAPADLPDAL